MSILEWGFITEVNISDEEASFNEEWYIHKQMNKIYSGLAFFTVIDVYQNIKDIPFKFTFEPSIQSFTYIHCYIAQPNRIQKKSKYKFKTITFKNFYNLFGIVINQNILNNHFYHVTTKRFKL